MQRFINTGVNTGISSDSSSSTRLSQDVHFCLRGSALKRHGTRRFRWASTRTGIHSQINIGWCIVSNKTNVHRNHCQPNSPPATEKSNGRMTNFWIRCAFDVALRLTSSMPFWMASLSAASLMTSHTVVALLPRRRHQRIASGVNVFRGTNVSGSTLVYTDTDIWQDNALLLLRENHLSVAINHAWKIN